MRVVVFGATGVVGRRAAALDRIRIPAETRERIADLMSAGASFIVTDHGLGPETGKETDFIVVTR